MKVTTSPRTFSTAASIAGSSRRVGVCQASRISWSAGGDGDPTPAEVALDDRSLAGRASCQDVRPELTALGGGGSGPGSVTRESVERLDAPPERHRKPRRDWPPMQALLAPPRPAERSSSTTPGGTTRPGAPSGRHGRARGHARGCHASARPRPDRGAPPGCCVDANLGCAVVGFRRASKRHKLTTSKRRMSFPSVTPRCPENHEAKGDERMIQSA